MAKLFLFRRIKERFIRPINPVCEFYFINIVKLHVFYVPREICSLASFSSTFLLVSTKEHQRENIPPKFRDGNVFDSFFFFLFFFFSLEIKFSRIYTISSSPSILPQPSTFVSFKRASFSHTCISLFRVEPHCLNHVGRNFNPSFRC